MGSFGNNTTMGKGDNKGLLKALNWFSVLCGLVTIGAGVMGCVWGVKVLKPWPPLTWNNFVGGLFMIGFGFAIVWLAVQENGREKGFFRTYFAFLDHLLGRGLFFLFIGMRVIPLGKFYCLVAGIVIFFSAWSTSVCTSRSRATRATIILTASSPAPSPATAKDVHVEAKGSN